MPNLKSKISSHNFHILKEEKAPMSRGGCNCRKSRGPCPLGGNCLTDNLVYRAEVIDENDNRKTYTGLTGNRPGTIATGVASRIENWSMIQPWLLIFGL